MNRRSKGEFSTASGSGTWITLGFFLILALGSISCRQSDDPQGPHIIIYTSQDQIHAEPVFEAFGAATGIKVKALYDNESAKSMGLAKRLAAESRRPVCDVFWSNESLTMQQLSHQGIVDSFDSFGYRMRVMIINTNAITPQQAPDSLHQWVEPKWREKCVMAYPLFGTTATHLLTLRQKWGALSWSQWCQGLKENEVRIVDGNSAVVRMVGSGDAWIGLTDSDDLAVGLSQGLPLMSIDLPGELCPISNTVGIVKGAPHPNLARSFAMFLRDSKILDSMVQSSALMSAQTIPENSNWLAPSWETLIEQSAEGLEQMRFLFMR
jgi:iron(III) transport system substrate-binding protein